MQSFALSPFPHLSGTSVVFPLAKCLCPHSYSSRGSEDLCIVSSVYHSKYPLANSNQSKETALKYRAKSHVPKATNSKHGIHIQLKHSYGGQMVKVAMKYHNQNQTSSAPCLTPFHLTVSSTPYLHLMEQRENSVHT